MEKNQNDKTRLITQALFFSGALNIVVLAVFFYWLVREVPPRPYCELKPAGQQEEQIPLAINHANADILRGFRSQPMEQLVANLNDTKLVENGYSMRDLALAALVDFHHFDISRALLGQAQPSQQRMMPYAKNREGALMDVMVYPGLTEQQFQAIIKYAQTERWPLTSQGLFQLLRKQRGQYDETLADAFFLTPEFLAVEMLFNRSEKSVEKKDLLAVLSQGDWKLISAFVEQQRLVQDLSPAKRQRFLIDFIDRESRAAAYLLLKTDGAFVFRKLDDEHVIAMLKLLVEKTPDAENFSLALLTSPRSDAVLQTASIRLYEYSGEPVPEKDVHKAALARFLSIRPTKEQTLQATVSPNPAKNANSGSPVIGAAKPSTTNKPKSNGTASTAVNKTNAAPLIGVPKSTAAKNTKKPAVTTAPASSTAVAKSKNKDSKDSKESKDSKDKKAVATTAATEKGSSKKSSEKETSTRRPRMYVVADGDSLWKISKRFDVDIEVLRKSNRLKNDSLKPGTALFIP